MTDLKQSPTRDLDDLRRTSFRWGNAWGPRPLHPGMSDRLLTNVHSLDKQPTKRFKGENDDITFRESDTHLVHHPHCDALVMTAMMANNNVHNILVDNGSSVDILYYQAFQKMGLKDSKLKPSLNPVNGFT